MKNGTPGFVPQRLTAAREARALTQVALAELIDCTSPTISKWENAGEGGHTPEPEALERLSQVLNVPKAYFLTPSIEAGKAPMFFRSMSSATLAARKRTEVRMRWAQEISFDLQSWLELPEVDVPFLEVENHKSISDEDIEVLAAKCRNQWGLGVGPIGDLLLTMENAGIVVIMEEFGTAKMDGLSNWSDADNRPYVLIAKDKAACVRSRMDAAHELGHIVLHRFIDQKSLRSSADFKEIENQAFRFAGAFLMPAESFGAEVSVPSLNTFLALKERWKTAIGAMIKRCGDLQLFDEEYERRLWKSYSSRRWRNGEPLDDELKIEAPRLLSRCVKLLNDEGVLLKSALADHLPFNASDIESLCHLPRKYFSNNEAEIISFARLKKEIEAD